MFRQLTDYRVERDYTTLLRRRGSTGIPAVTPASASIGTSATQQFTADIAVTWSVASGGGSISVGGLYTAPVSAGSATVRATSTVDITKTTDVPITIVTTLKTSLVDLWQTEEASGNRVGAHAGLILSPTNAPGNAAGKIGQGLSLNGTTQYVGSVDNADLSMGDIPFTIAGWINPAALPQTAQILGKGTISTNTGMEYAVWITGSRLKLNISNGTTYVNVSADLFGDLTAGTMYFFSVEHDPVANTAALAVNTIRNSAPYSGGSFDSTFPFRIGAASGGNYLFAGVVDEVGVWKRLLSPSELSALFNGGSGLAYSNFGNSY